MAGSTTPRAASTLVVLRDGPDGLEVLLMRRADKGDHNSGAWVFPGGLVDAADRGAHTLCDGLDDAAASAALGLDAHGLDHYVAAVRECFEEAGLLFAHDVSLPPAATDAPAPMVNLDGALGDTLAALRAPLGRGEQDFADLCRRFGLRPAVGDLHYVAHWLTPVGRAKRFDTRFFVAALPRGQASAHDTVETLEQVWLRPVVALAAENTRRLMTPTRAVIEQLSAFADTAAALAWARSPRSVVRVLPRLAVDSSGARPVLPHEAAWAELGHVDPDGRGDAWAEMRPGVPVRLSAHVLRVASADGANSYLISDGDAGDGCAVIGPASADVAHVDALLAAAPGPITRILPTDQRDPLAAASALQARTGARLYGRVPGAGGAMPDTPVRDGDQITIGAGVHLRVIDAGAALAYLLCEDRMLFAADAAAAPQRVAGQSTPVAWLAPPRGFLVALSMEQT